VQDSADDIALRVPAATGDLLTAAARLALHDRDTIVRAGAQAFRSRDMAEAMAVPAGTVMSRRARAALDLADQPA
jgi:DNA-directed RNA polymerase specialized sigma24 family protein